MALPLTVDRVKASLKSRISTQSFRFYETSKQTLHHLTGARPKATLFIFGCQRSGTTHLERLLRADPRTVVFGEFSDLSIDPSKTVWRDLPEVSRRLKKANGQIAVARSLYASHRAQNILAASKGSKAVWVFRRSEEVVASMLRKWDGNFEDISRRVETDASNCWELEPLWQQAKDGADRIGDAERGSPEWTRDLYALYWHARNAAYFTQPASKGRSVRLLDYATLVDKPSDCIAALVDDLNLPKAPLNFPLATGRLNQTSFPAGYFSKAVREKCDALLAKLISAEDPV